jgi:hypothetical protein
MKDIKMQPRLLAKLAVHAADKESVLQPMLTLLPDLCQV